jgi:5-methylcytosine-specific restriction enzyme A
VVDHITPHRGDERLFWDTANHQAMAKRCHDPKTAREDGGFGHAIG